MHIKSQQSGKDAHLIIELNEGNFIVWERIKAKINLNV